MVVRLCRGKGRKAEATVEVETKEKVFAEVLGGSKGGKILPGEKFERFFWGGLNSEGDLHGSFTGDFCGISRIIMKMLNVSMIVALFGSSV